MLKELKELEAYRDFLEEKSIYKYSDTLLKMYREYNLDNEGCYCRADIYPIHEYLNDTIGIRGLTEEQYADLMKRRLSDFKNLKDNEVSDYLVIVDFDLRFTELINVFEVFEFAYTTLLNIVADYNNYVLYQDINNPIVEYDEVLNKFAQEFFMGEFGKLDRYSYLDDWTILELNGIEFYIYRPEYETSYKFKIELEIEDCLIDYILNYTYEALIDDAMDLKATSSTEEEFKNSFNELLEDAFGVVVDYEVDKIIDDLNEGKLVEDIYNEILKYI